jgi:DNA modification methylase
MNQLYYGDNLNVLRDSIKDETVDLIYLDPPFNSKRHYNLLFKSPAGHESEAQVTAFEDSWRWGEQAEREFDEILHQPKTDVAELLQAMRAFLGENDLMAYLTMMSLRLIELHRVLKPTGSTFLHCDPTASHYLKIILDAVFDSKNFRNEIVWDYSFRLMDLPHFYNRKHDIILFYAKTQDAVFHMPKTEWTRDDLLKSRKQAIHLDKEGIEWIWMPGGKGHSKNKLRRVDDILAGGKAMSDVWPLPIISSSSKERIGYPTQKPLLLLERIIEGSSNEGDVVLDPFCGCGTAVHAAQKLRRKWIGIDITHLAISLVEKRLNDAFNHKEYPPDQQPCQFEVHGTPKDLGAAEDLAKRDKYQFQWWAVSLVQAQPFQGKRKGADTGIDGLKFFSDYKAPDTKKEKDKKGFKTCKIVVSVKGGSIRADDVRALNHVRERENAEIALFVTLEEPTRGMVGDAVSAGFYESANGKKYPRVQLLTIRGLLNKTQRAEHPDYEPEMSFKKAKGESMERQEGLI